MACTEEKILYFAFNGKYTEFSEDLKRNDAKFNLLYDMSHVKKYLKWSADYGINEYTITELGILRHYIYRLNYAKNNEPMSYEKRLIDLKDAVKMYPNSAEDLKKILSKKSRKLFNKAFE